MLLAGAFSFAQANPEVQSAKIAKDSIIQFIEITGTVEDLGPVYNAFVYEKGRPNSARTDKDGRFTITIPLEHFKDPVCLEFEISGTSPVEKIVLPTTKSVKVRLSEPKKRAKTKWVVTTEIQKPDVGELILYSLDKILRFALHAKGDNNDDEPKPREVHSKTPRF